MMTGAKPLHCGIYQIKRRTTVLDTTVARLFKPYNKKPPAKPGVFHMRA